MLALRAQSGFSNRLRYFHHHALAGAATFQVEKASGGENDE
jgi:hypothetical protein